MLGSGLHNRSTSKNIISNKFSALFDGTDDYVDASTVASDISLTTGTISLWANVTSLDHSFPNFWNCADGTSTDDKIFIHYNKATSKIRAIYKSGGGSEIAATHDISNSDLINAGWFHIVMTYDTTADEIKLYYNGSASATGNVQDSQTITPINSSSVTLDTVHLGKPTNTTSNNLLTGRIDEYAYFARVLTAAEVSDIYAAKARFNYKDSLSLKGSANQLKQWLRFGDGIVSGLSDTNSTVDDRIILDMANPTVGSELVIDGTFDVGDTNADGSHANLSTSSLRFDNWIEQNSSGERTYTKITNGTRCTIVTSTDNTWHTRLYQTINPVLDVGGFYYFSVTALASIDCIFRLAIQQTNSTTNQFLGEGSNVAMTANEKKRNQGFFLCDNNTSQVIHLFPNFSSSTPTSDGTDGEFYEVSNVSLKKLQGNTAFASGANIKQENVPS